MKSINRKYTLIKKIQEPKQEGFATVDIQDSSIYKGEVHTIPETPVFVDNHQVLVGDIVQFAKYSPDTHEVDIDGVKMKMVKVEDILMVL